MDNRHISTGIIPWKSIVIDVCLGDKYPPVIWNADIDVDIQSWT